MLAAQQAMHVADRLGAKVLADRVGAQGQRQTGLLEPPLAGIDDQLQSLVGVGQLAFVDNQSGVDRLPLILPRRPRHRESGRRATRT